MRAAEYGQAGSTSTDDEDPWKDAVPSSGRPAPPRKPSRRPSDFHSFPNSPKSVRSNLPTAAEQAAEDEGDEEDEEDWEVRLRRAKEEGEGRWAKGRRTARKWARTANEFMTVP